MFAKAVELDFVSKTEIRFSGFRLTHLAVNKGLEWPLLKAALYKLKNTTQHTIQQKLVPPQHHNMELHIHFTKGTDGPPN